MESPELSSEIQSEVKWVRPHPNSNPPWYYAPAPSCPFCKGNIRYVHDAFEYYLGGHEEDCYLFGNFVVFEKEEEMIRKWEHRDC